MRVLLCGGGTAGHVMPAIAMAEIIKKSFPGSVIAFAGRRDGNENLSYEKSGHTLYTVDIVGLRRSLSINNIKAVFKAIKSSRDARAIITEFNPDLIIGTGGYVCYPFIRQGQRLGIKTMMHESNVAPGLVTRLLGRKCEKVMLNLEGTRKSLKYAENTVVVGNPTRSDFGTMSKMAARRRLGVRDDETLIVSFGGSLGAGVLNRAVGELIGQYTLGSEKIRHIHATGKGNFEEMKNQFPSLFLDDNKVKIVPYIDDMPTHLIAADLAITRSGAITVSELCRSGTPSILIPSPNVTANHQYANADYMRSLGASRLIEENELSAKRLYDEVNAILKSDEEMKKMARRAKGAYTRDTEKAIGNLIAKAVK